MLIRIGYDMTFDVTAPTPMVLSLYVYPDRAADLERPETIYTEPAIPFKTYIDVFGNRCAVIVAPPGPFRIHSSNVIRDEGLPDARDFNAKQHPIEELPTECIQYLLASRYCEVDQLTEMAWKEFGNIPPGWQRVQAVCDWVHGNVEFGYKYASKTKTSVDVCTDRRGVCRDFTHLAITFLRALNIPARYATGYLGDIGVPKDPAPMDFAAFLEVYLGNRWWPVDVRHNKARIGRIPMARGRDAVDVPLTTIFGAASLTKFLVICEEQL